MAKEKYPQAEANPDVNSQNQPHPEVIPNNQTEVKVVKIQSQREMLKLTQPL